MVAVEEIQDKVERILAKDNFDAAMDEDANRESLYHGRKVFGRNIFNREDLTFEPVMNIATPQN